jgi:hypothetical protein
MAQPSSQADFLNAFQHRLNALEVNINELQHLDSRRLKLQEIHKAAIVAFQDQSAATAAKQDASRRLEDLLSEGQTVMTFLSAGIREHYGKDSEKLAEFKLQPFRGRRASAESKKKEKKPKKKDGEPAMPPTEPSEPEAVS